MSICDCCAEEADGCIIESEHGATLCPDCVRELTTGAVLISAERDRQIEAEGWTPQHDDEHDRGELIEAAISYAVAGRRTQSDPILPGDRLPYLPWPWDESGWKPSDDPIRNLVKAGALIAAEIDRLQRRGSAGE